jgi:hypothetical protein
MFDTECERIVVWIGLQWFADKDCQNINKILAAHQIPHARYIVRPKIVDTLLLLNFSAAVYVFYRANAVY